MDPPSGLRAYAPHKKLKNTIATIGRPAKPKRCDAIRVDAGAILNLIAAAIIKTGHSTMIVNVEILDNAGYQL